MANDERRVERRVRKLHNIEQRLEKRQKRYDRRIRITNNERRKFAQEIKKDLEEYVGAYKQLAEIENEEAKAAKLEKVLDVASETAEIVEG